MLETHITFLSIFLLLKFSFSYDTEEQLNQKRENALLLFVTKSNGQFHAYQTFLHQGALTSQSHQSKGIKSGTKPPFSGMPCSLMPTSVSTLVKCWKCSFPINLGSGNG